jgi:hypothetical protein
MERTRLDGESGVRGSNDGEVVSLSSPKKRLWPCLASNFSSEVPNWFIDDSSEEISSSSSSSGESEESLSPPSSSESHSLFLAAEDSASSSNLRLSLFLLDAILWRRESVGRERESDRLDERECGGGFYDLGDGGGRGDEKCRVGTELKPAPVDI